MMKCLAIYISHQNLLNAKAFKLREEWRYRTNELYESNLKISRGPYYKSSWESCVFNHWCPECSWATCRWYIMFWQWYQMYIELYICCTVVPVYILFGSFHQLWIFFEAVKEMEIIQAWSCMSIDGDWRFFLFWALQKTTWVWYKVDLQI